MNDRSRTMITKKDLSDFLLIFIGAVIQAFSLNFFMLQANLASGGISGISQIIHHYTGWPIGLMVLIGNVPLFILGWRYLGGPRFASRTVFAVVSYSVAVDLISQFAPTQAITQDTLLNALYGGVISGVGFALVYRGRGTSGGTDILARIIIHFRNIPLSQTYLLTDAFTMLLAGLAFGWEKALYAIVMLYTSGISAETVTQGSRIAYTAMIITSQDQLVADQIMENLERGVTRLSGRGMYTGQERAVLYCVIARSEVERIKSIVAAVDPNAFIVIGQAYEALGEGFHPIGH